MTKVEEPTQATKEDEEIYQDIDQGKSPNEGQNNVEEEVQGKITEVEESTKVIKEDQEIN